MVLIAAMGSAAADEPQLGAEVPVAGLTTNIATSGGEMPENFAAEAFRAEGALAHLPGTSRNWASSGIEWEASSIRFEPLIFEDVSLERTGYNFGWLQPGVSAVRFFGRIPFVPYYYVAEGGKAGTYTLGHYRPGSCVPYAIQKVPYSFEGALVQGGLTTAMFFVVP